jgi:hypothetical protein
MDPDVNAEAPNESSFSASALSERALSTPAVSARPAELSDAELLAATRGLVGRSNRLLASLLGHLAEVEARGVYRTRACSSLYTYCVYELRFSEDEAFRRVSAARLIRRFPVLLDAIAAGELHLTGLLMLGPHLTTENLAEVLARAKHRTKKEIGRLVRMLDPLPDVPSRIDPLGPEPMQLVPAAPTWSQFVGSINPTRELAPGDRPLDWTVDIVEEPVGDRCQALVELTLPDGPALARGEFALPDGAAPARLTPQRYKVQFTASEEYVNLVERAKALLSHSARRAGLDEIHLRAMRALVAELERQRYAVTVRPQQRTRATSMPAAPTPEGYQARERFGEGRSNQEPESECEPALNLESECESEPAVESVSEPAFESASARAAEPDVAHDAEPGRPRWRRWRRWRGRYVPSAVRRAVFVRDQGRCSYTGDTGQRCRETNGLELHHSKAFARGGEHSEENITLRCRAHNDFAAETDFARDYIELARETKHEPWTTHEAARGDARAGLR